jgi:hypothetical protein
MPEFTRRKEDTRQKEFIWRKDMILGSQFQRFQLMAADPIVVGLRWGWTSWWTGSRENGSTEGEGVILLVNSFLQPGPICLSSCFLHSPNDATKLRIHHWINPFTKSQPSPTNHFSKATPPTTACIRDQAFYTQAFWGTLHFQTITPTMC